MQARSRITVSSTLTLPPAQPQNAARRLDLDRKFGTGFQGLEVWRAVEKFRSWPLSQVLGLLTVTEQFTWEKEAQSRRCTRPD